MSTAISAWVISALIFTLLIVIFIELRKITKVLKIKAAIQGHSSHLSVETIQEIIGKIENT